MKNKSFIFGLLLLVASLANAQDIGSPDPQSLSKAYPGKAYSPWAGRDLPTFPLWGETHLHTAYSVDAALFGNRLLHEDAYRLARGLIGGPAAFRLLECGAGFVPQASK